MNTPKEIVRQYEAAHLLKNSLGEKGLYSQNAINRRFYTGDQWYGANIGADKPLVRHNVIKQIGDYKMGELLKNSANIEILAEGISYTALQNETTRTLKENMSKGDFSFSENTNEEELRLLTSALENYLKVTKSRLHFDSLSADILKNSFITGSGVLYSYWDGLADNGSGNIACEVLPIENIFFGDISETDIENQPYIIIVTHCDTASVKRTAEAFSLPSDKIVPDSFGKTTVYTKLYKETDGKNIKVMAVSVTEKAFVRMPYDTKLSRYPINMFCWEKRENCIYGDSEITYLIPNQIAINRMLTASVWSSMNMGMPIMTVNGDTVTGDITNEPGQIIKVYGTNEDVAGAIKYVTPPDFSANFLNSISALIEGTLESSGSGIAAISKSGYNTAAAVENISAVSGISKEILNLRYSCFLEEVALLWLDFWKNKFGKRQLLIKDENGVWYFPFDSARYKNIIFKAKAVKEENNETA